MPATPNITLTATLDDTSGNADANSCLWITLCGFYQTVPKITGTSMLAKIGPIRYLAADGVFSIPLWANDQITPIDTYYCIEIQDDKGNIPQAGMYQFTGSGTIDLSNAVQLDLQPTPVYPPLSAATYTIISYASSVSFPATSAQVQTFDITLTGNVTSSSASGFVEGQVVIFLIRQDATGGWTFAWPSQFQNPPTVDPAASSVTAAVFVVDQALNFYPLSGGTWSA
jgi:hypothetical protein